jgi:hypothetical protein
MTSSNPIPDHPFERFLAIYAVLRDEGAWQGAWLRFAAQAAVSVPGDPRAIAEAIRSMAGTLHAHVSRLDALHSPLRYVVAAMLVQAGDTAADFIAELVRTRQLFRQTGIVHGGIYEIMAILLLRIAGDRNRISRVQVERLRAIYLQLKRFHWWLTGPHDLPTCAMLIGLPGTPEDIGRLVEEHYHLLSDDGFSTGRQLEQAAHILPLLRLPAKQAVHRYGALGHRFASHGTPPWREDYEAIAILSFLHHDAESVASLCLTLHQKLVALRPALHHEILIDLAADLTVLDLVHQQVRQLDPLDEAARSGLARTLRDAQNAAAVIACFGARSADPSSY